MVIKAYAYETVWTETQINLFRIFSGEKYGGGGDKISDLRFAGTNPRLAEKNKIQMLATLCLFQGRTLQVFNWDTF